MQASIAISSAPNVQYVLRLADSCLILAQRLGEWCGHAPALEEDIALTNMALDLLGQAPMPSAVNCVSGVSSTGDIEFVYVRGVHGPLSVHVIGLDWL